MDVIFRFSYSLEPDPYPYLDTWGDHFNAMWAHSKRENSMLRRDKYERQRVENPELPEVIELISDTPIPQLVMESFNREALGHSRDLGKRIVSDNLENIRSALQRAADRKAS